MVSVAIGLFEERRKIRAWEREAIEAESNHQPVLAPSRRRRIQAKQPKKLAAARKRMPTKKSKLTEEANK
jgi:hypothetical protein